MQLSIFHVQDQPDLMVKCDLVTETLSTNQLHVLYESLPLLFTFQLELLMVKLFFTSNKGSYSCSYFIL